MYKLIKNSNGQICSISIIGTNTTIPLDESNSDYQTYLRWLDGYEDTKEGWVKTSEGNTPLPADEA